FSERVRAVAQLLNDLVGDVGLGALAGFVAVLGMVTRAVAELVEGQRDVSELGHLGRVVVAGHPLEVPVPLARLVAEQIDRDAASLARGQRCLRPADVSPDRVRSAVARDRARRARRLRGVGVLYLEGHRNLDRGLRGGAGGRRENGTHHRGEQRREQTAANHEASPARGYVDTADQNPHLRSSRSTGRSGPVIEGARLAYSYIRGGYMSPRRTPAARRSEIATATSR